MRQFEQQGYPKSLWFELHDKFGIAPFIAISYKTLFYDPNVEVASVKQFAMELPAKWCL